MNVPENRREFHQFSGTIAPQSDVDLSDGNRILDNAIHLAFYATLTAIFLMIIAMIVKLLWSSDEEEEEGSGEATGRTSEHSRLFSKGEGAYGTYIMSWKDLESGSGSSSDDDLYDGKICVICYDDQRNYFFIPCGHCIACGTCAKRIMKEENRSCPICRGIIEKTRKLHIL